MPIAPSRVISAAISVPNSGKSRANTNPLTVSCRPSSSAAVIIPHFCRASCPSQPVLYPTAIPSRLGSAVSAAARVSTTRCPREPLGALSLATSTSVSTPSNGSRFGCPCTSGNATAIARSSTRPSAPARKRSELSPATPLVPARKAVRRAVGDPSTASGIVTPRSIAPPIAASSRVYFTGPRRAPCHGRYLALAFAPPTAAPPPPPASSSTRALAASKRLCPSALEADMPPPYRSRSTRSVPSAPPHRRQVRPLRSGLRSLAAPLRTAFARTAGRDAAAAPVVLLSPPAFLPWRSWSRSSLWRVTPQYFASPAFVPPFAPPPRLTSPPTRSAPKSKTGAASSASLPSLCYLSRIARCTNQVRHLLCSENPRQTRIFCHSHMRSP